jgi:hypothetical protein
MVSYNLLLYVTMLMGNLSMVILDTMLSIRNMHLNRTTAMAMVILDTMLPLRTSSKAGYPQQPDPYARPPYSGPGQWTPQGCSRRRWHGSYQAPPASYGPPSQQPPAYGQTYGAATGPDGYGQQGYPQQGGQVPASYGQSAPAAPGYPQQGGYAQYPQTQPAYGDQAAA